MVLKGIKTSVPHLTVGAIWHVILILKSPAIAAGDYFFESKTSIFHTKSLAVQRAYFRYAVIGIVIAFIVNVTDAALMAHESGCLCVGEIFHR
jgi:hypothetical protein